uniref:Uncharacterized protein n=1 Tax=Rhizophora mucronata TaxID=61149 RepID=A0A2P2QDI8_RHIMU
MENHCPMFYQSNRTFFPMKVSFHV